MLAHPLEHARLQREHLAAIGLVVVAAQVEDAVHHRLPKVDGVLGADHHVAKLARARGHAHAVDGEGEHVGGAVTTAVLAVQRLDLLRAYEGHGQVPLLHAGRLEGSERGGAHEVGVGVEDLDLDGPGERVDQAGRREPGAGLSSVACVSAWVE